MPDTGPLYYPERIAKAYLLPMSTVCKKFRPNFEKKEKAQNLELRMFTGLVFLDLRTFRAGRRLLPRDLTGNRIPAIIISLSRKPGPGFSKIRHLLFDSRFTNGRRNRAP